MCKNWTNDPETVLLSHPNIIFFLLYFKYGDIFISTGKNNADYPHLLQLRNLFVEVGYVLLDDKGQLLDLHWLVIENCFLPEEKI